MRVYSVARDVKSACFVCHGDIAHWHGPNAQALAALHHDKTGHQTWVDVNMCITYGESDKKKDSNKE
jgi:hypothetical protein